MAGITETKKYFYYPIITRSGYCILAPPPPYNFEPKFTNELSEEEDSIIIGAANQLGQPERFGEHAGTDNEEMAGGVDLVYGGAGSLHG